MTTVRLISALAIKYSSITPVVQVMFQQQHVETNKSTGQARFSVTFTPLNTEIPFTFIVETFDLLPSDARGLQNH